MFVLLTVIGLLTSLVGLAGYILVPSKVFDQEKHLKSITIFYMIISMSLILHALYHLLLEIILVEIVIGVFLTIAALYFIISTETRWSIEISRLRDALLYASVIWLMGRELKFLSSLEFCLTILVGLVSSTISIITLQALMKIKKHKTFFILEEFSTIFSDSFFAVFVMGLGILALGDPYYESIHPLTMVLAAGIITYVLIKIHKAVKPYLSE